MPICSECGKQMLKGYCIQDGMQYFCSDECLHKNISEEDYLEMFDDGEGDSYWTEWEDEQPFNTHAFEPRENT